MIKRLITLLKRKDFKPVFNFFSFVTGNAGQDRRDFYYGIVFRCVDAIATSVATNQFDLYQVNKDGEAKKNVNHKAITLLRRPNKFQTGVDLLYLVSSHIDAYGAAYIYPVKALNNEPTELWTLDPARVQVVRGEGFIKGYVFTNPKGEKVPFAVDELFEIKRPHPFDPYEGVSTIEMAKLTIEGDLNAQMWNRNFFKNGAIPSGVLTTESNLGDAEFERVKEQFHEKYEGKENAYKTLVLEGGLKYQQLALNQKDMDFLEQRKLHRDEILSIFQVPKTIVAVTDDVNRANAETSEYVFARRTVKPRLELIFEKFNVFYLPMFKGTEGFDLKFDDPVPADRQLALEEDKNLVNRVLTINEVRAKRGYEPLEGGDELYLNLAAPTNLADTNTANSPKSVSKAVRTTKARQLLAKRDRYLKDKEHEFHLKLGAHWDFLIKDIESGKATKAQTGVEEVLASVIPSLNAWTQTTGEIVLTFGDATLRKAVTDAGTIYSFPMNFSLEHSGAISWLNKRSQDTATSMRDTLLNRSREVIARNLADNITSVSKIRQEVADTLKEEKDWRVDRVVRNELLEAYSEGSFRTYEASGVVTQVEWITADDERVCPICEPNNGKHAGIGELFPSGDDRPPAHTQCRCQAVPFFG
jgi:HK97 family phage portal protein